MTIKEMRSKTIELLEFYKKIGYDEKLKQIDLFVKKRAPKLPYHNYKHALMVCDAARFYGVNEGIFKENIFLLETAALLHDVVYVKGRTDNEEQSAKFATLFLLKQGYSSSQINIIYKLILATKMPTKPRGILQRIMCDCDVGYIGTKEFDTMSEKLRLEFGVEKRKWYNEDQPNFLRNHKYYTKTAKELGGSKKQEILARPKLV